MIQILHSHFTSKIREHHDTIIGTFLSTCISQRRHTISKIHQRLHSFHTATGSSHSRRLRNSIDTYPLFTSINITKTASYRLKQCFGIGHIIVTEKSTLCSNIAQCQYRTILCNSIHLFSHLYHLMKRDSRNIESFVQKIIIKIIIRTFFPNIGRHTDRM